METSLRAVYRSRKQACASTENRTCHTKGKVVQSPAAGENLEHFQKLKQLPRGAGACGGEKISRRLS